jgi:hypothetical protein
LARIIRTADGHDTLVDAHSTGGLITPLWAHGSADRVVDAIFSTARSSTSTRDGSLDIRVPIPVGSSATSLRQRTWSEAATPARHGRPHEGVLHDLMLYAEHVRAEEFSELDRWLGA